MPDTHPPLFIPENFFDKRVKICYNNKSYKHGYVNMNPNAEKYSFEDNKEGTDLKKSLNEIPFFWKDFICS